MILMNVIGCTELHALCMHAGARNLTPPAVGVSLEGGAIQNFIRRAKCGDNFLF